MNATSYTIVILPNTIFVLFVRYNEGGKMKCVIVDRPGGYMAEQVTMTGIYVHNYNYTTKIDSIS